MTDLYLQTQTDGITLITSTPRVLPTTTDTISNFNFAPIDIINANFWFKVVFTNEPLFDERTQFISSSYVKSGTEFVQTWIVNDKPPEEVDEYDARIKQTLHDFNQQKKQEMMNEGKMVSLSTGKVFTPYTQTLEDLINIMGSVLGAVVKENMGDATSIKLKTKNEGIVDLSNAEMIETGLQVFAFMKILYETAWDVERQIDSQEITIQTEVENFYSVSI